MNRKRLRMMLLGGALALAVVGAGLASRKVPPRVAPSAAAVPDTLEPMELAALLTQGPPDVVVVALDGAEHPLLGSVPAASFGPDDEALVAGAPKARRVVLAGKDPVRVDRLARRLMATGRDVRILEGGIQAWDQAMARDPLEPPEGVSAELLARYRTELALRHYFGDESAAPPPVVGVAAPPTPAAGGPGAPKKREGC
jgi:hypothetical protein